MYSFIYLVFFFFFTFALTLGLDCIVTHFVFLYRFPLINFLQVQSHFDVFFTDYLNQHIDETIKGCSCFEILNIECTLLYYFVWREWKHISSSFAGHNSVIVSQWKHVVWLSHEVNRSHFMEHLLLWNYWQSKDGHPCFGTLPDVFSEIDKVCLLLQEKQWAAFGGNYKS